jgi:coenzyme Q-binding protein COQ10
VSQIERVHLTYKPAQMFDLVADVERYPDFLPWVIEARIVRRRKGTVWVDQTIGTRFVHRRFTTMAKFDRPRSIKIGSRDPMFARFEQTWTFRPAQGGGTDVEYRMDLKFRSHLLQALIGPSFAERARIMTDAFRHRARALYGV